MFQNVGPLNVVEHDVVHGKFVVLENTSEEDMQLGGWKIVHRSGTVEVRCTPYAEHRATSSARTESRNSPVALTFLRYGRVLLHYDRVLLRNVICMCVAVFIPLLNLRGFRRRFCVVAN